MAGNERNQPTNLGDVRSQQWEDLSYEDKCAEMVEALFYEPERLISQKNNPAVAFLYSPATCPSVPAGVVDITSKHLRREAYYELLDLGILEDPKEKDRLHIVTDADYLLKTTVGKFKPAGKSKITAYTVNPRTKAQNGRYPALKMILQQHVDTYSTDIRLIGIEYMYVDEEFIAKMKQ